MRPEFVHLGSGKTQAIFGLVLAIQHMRLSLNTNVVYHPCSFISSASQFVMVECEMYSFYFKEIKKLVTK